MSLDFWTDEITEQAKALWTEGRSASQIGAVLGCSRNAVLSKIHRIGAAQREHGAVRSPRRTAPIIRSDRRAVQVPPRPKPNEPPALVLASGEKATLVDLERGMCKWPHGEVGSQEFHFCGQQARLSEPWCDYHRSVAWVPNNRRRSAREPSHAPGRAWG